MLDDKKTQILAEIDRFCSKNDVSLLDGIVHWCENNNVEIEYVASLIKKDQNFKAKLQIEAENLNIMKKSARLPI